MATDPKYLAKVLGKERGYCIHASPSLFIKLLEWAREDAKDDMDLHEVAEKMLAKEKLWDINDFEDLVEEDD